MKKDGCVNVASNFCKTTYKNKERIPSSSKIMAGSMMDMLSEHKVLVACIAIAIALVIYMYYRKRSSNPRPCMPHPSAAAPSASSPNAAPSVESASEQVAGQISAIASNAAQVGALATQGAKDKESSEASPAIAKA